MDKRKLIGTIIGVMMFAALIVGATYAWLYFTANVTNTNTSGQTLTYWIDYEKGTDITELPILSAPTTSNTSVTTITAKQPQYSIANNINIYLTSSGDLSTSQAIRYIICKNACTDADFSTTNVKTVTTQSTVLILTENWKNQANDDDPYSNSNPIHTYKVYFWLDAATLTNDHIGDSYLGSIHADSSQDTTKYG